MSLKSQLTRITEMSSTVASGIHSEDTTKLKSDERGVIETPSESMEETSIVNATTDGEATTTTVVDNAKEADANPGPSLLTSEEEAINAAASGPSLDNGVTDTVVKAALESIGEDMGIVDVDKTTEDAALGGTSIAGKNGKAFFPMKLFDIVSDEKTDDIIKWLPGGKSFIIVDKKRFAQEVLPKHFQQSQFTSFTRKLSRWKFTRVPRGPFIGAYYNKLFLKDHRTLCWHMRCKSENVGKLRFDSKIADSLNSSLDQTSRLLMGAGNPINSIPGMPAAFVPGMPIAGIPGMPMAFGAPYSGMMMNAGLNSQLLAIEGKLRELQNANTYNMYEQQQKAFLAQQQQQQQQGIDEATRAAMGDISFSGQQLQQPSQQSKQEEEAPTKTTL